MEGEKEFVKMCIAGRWSLEEIANINVFYGTCLAGTCLEDRQWEYRKLETVRLQAAITTSR